MTNSSKKTWRIGQPGSQVGTAARAIGLIGILFLAMPNASAAQDASFPQSLKRVALPEAILVPKKFNGRTLINGGWTLIFHNGLQGPEVPEFEVGWRMVDVKGAKAKLPSQLISWEIVRTRNNSCPDHDHLPCPDEIRVLALPQGFVAVPERAWVREGETLQIHIVPAGIG